MVQSKKPDQTVPSKGPTCTLPGPQKTIEKPARSENEACDAFAGRFNNPPEDLAEFVGDAVELHGAFVAVKLNMKKEKVEEIHLMGKRAIGSGKLESIRTGRVLQMVCSHFLYGPMYMTVSSVPNRMYKISSIRTWFQHNGINDGSACHLRYFPLVQNKDGSLEYDTQGFEKELEKEFGKKFTMTPLPGRQVDGANVSTTDQDLEKQVAVITEKEREASRERCDECEKVRPCRRLHNTRGTASMKLCDGCYKALDPSVGRVCVCDWDADARSCTCFETIDDLC